MSLNASIRKRLPHFELNVELCCAPGRLTALVGPSGAGKTTLVRLLAGLERPDQGVITMGEAVWVDTTRRRFVPPRKRGLGLVFQDYCLFPHLSVRQNVAFAATQEHRVDELMERFGIHHLQHRKPSAISGGERQRAAFCQALARNPSLLLLDEPFSALDAATREALRKELKDLKTSLDIPVIHVTHDLAEARYLGDTILPVVSGRVAPDWLERQYVPFLNTSDTLPEPS